ncbi:hypothetical protein IE53DRAFT_390028 [Violaceomyces palustris]|uniref:Uncharacterized protein n=1 Tax=Violaceomyces palustris TaxID=1673888 RepID=A0ACD0NPT0_9BASI|nr:hypothetical protein IE53DRAFT_390028 [Violaceomyces palustris]
MANSSASSSPRPSQKADDPEEKGPRTEDNNNTLRQRHLQQQQPNRSKPSPSSSGWISSPLRKLELEAFKLYRNVWATFAFGMLEPWEIVLIITVASIITLLLWYSLLYHFPSHIRTVVRRAAYYIYGSAHHHPQADQL